MIYMRKVTVAVSAMILSFVLASSAMAQFNQNAYFLVDQDLATKGFQGATTAIKNIGPTAQVGFALYSQAWDSALGLTVHFEWDAAKGEFRKASGGPSIVDNQLTINGASITPPVEDNILGSSTITAGEINTPGVYEISFAKQGGTASKTAVGLIYFAVFRTLATFKTTDAFVVSAQVTVSDETAKTRFLGTRYFRVNQEIDVKNSSWGAVKKQFKDF
jgi:hypothetical protein